MEKSSNTITVVSLKTKGSDTPGVRLLSVKVFLSMFGQSEQIVTALIDCGSSHSFISPLVLSGVQMIMCTKLGEIQKNEVQIDTAYNSTNSPCVFIDAKIKIESFKATQAYIISQDIKNYEMILGMDFLGKRINLFFLLNFNLIIKQLDLIFSS